MSSLFRRDDTLTDFMGHPISGVKVYVCSQPADTSTIPPSPLAPIFADPAGKNLLTVPPQTNQDGLASFYAAPGLYTLVFHSSQIATPTQTLVLPDQAIAGLAPIPPQYVSDSSANGSIHPSPDGVNRAFDLSTIPNPAGSLVFCVNSVVQTGYTLVFATVSLPVAPPPGALLTATYQV